MKKSGINPKKPMAFLIFQKNQKTWFKQKKTGFLVGYFCPVRSVVLK
jgi:hypothetical protein